MRRFLRKSAIFSIAVVGYLLIGTADVQADVVTGYVCQARFRPAATSSYYGNYGYIFVTVTNSPDCSGTLTSNYVYSEGATTSSVDNAFYLYNDSQMNALIQMLWHSVITDQRVYVYYSSSTNQIYYINPRNE